MRRLLILIIRYDISGNQVTFNDEGGDYSADVPGVYEFKVEDASMTLKEIDDPVDGRRMLMEGALEVIK